MSNGVSTAQAAGNGSRYWRVFLGEVIGTFWMCFLGIGAVATATLYGSHTGPFQVGLVWGIAIAIGIFMTRNLSAAHFNPAVTFAMCLSKRLPWKEFFLYVIGQFVGAIIAALLLWVLFADSVYANMNAAGVTMAERGTASSIWVEVFPNTSAGVVTWPIAMLAEATGVFILVMVIFSLTESCNAGRTSDNIFPLFIGLTVSMIICVVGPLTDAGLNPARDLGPRIVAAMVGWGSVACTWQDIVVYTIGPLLGSAVAVLLFCGVVEPAHKKAIAAASANPPEKLEPALADAEQDLRQK